MNIELLSHHSWTIPTIANWYYQEWGHVNAAITVQDIEEDLAGYTIRDALPQALVAIEGAAVFAVAELKIREVRALPHYEHWIGGVYVDRDHREKGLAGELVQCLIQMARDDYNIEALYLQTERLDGGLYIRHGWTEIQRISVSGQQRLVMVSNLHENKHAMNHEAIK